MLAVQISRTGSFGTHDGRLSAQFAFEHAPAPTLQLESLVSAHQLFRARQKQNDCLVHCVTAVCGVAALKITMQLHADHAQFAAQPQRLSRGNLDL